MTQRDCPNRSYYDPRLIETIDLKNSFGITFFVRHRVFIAIHEHTRFQPTAVDTYRQISAGDRCGLLWLYLAISDGVMEIGRLVNDGFSRLELWVT